MTINPPAADPVVFDRISSHGITVVGERRLRKDLSDAGLTDAAKMNRWADLHDPTREPHFYRSLLGSYGISPHCFASGEDWIEIEKLDAVPLRQSGEVAVWIAAAGWLGELHVHMSAPVVRTLCSDVPLVEHTRERFDAWRRRAAGVGVDPAVLSAHEQACERLLAAPRTIIHGDFYPSNVLVDLRRPPGEAIWAIDWELVGDGPGVLDLAAITSGAGHTAETKRAMEDAYCAAKGVSARERDEWQCDLEAARLHLCVQWLAFAANSDWAPPPWQKHDWLGDAQQLAVGFGALPAAAATANVVPVADTPPDLVSAQRAPLLRTLIVNADDFGQSHDINRGIFEAAANGIVTSASMMVRWPAAEEAAAWARDHPEVSVGLHIDLGEWSVIDGEWHEMYRVVGEDDADAIAAEVDRQVGRFVALVGRVPTHIDSHQHSHRDGVLTPILVTLGERLGVDVRDLVGDVSYCGRFYGQYGKGVAYPEGITVEALVALLAELPEGTTELGCHPASGTLDDLGSMYRLERLTELQTLCDPRVRAALLDQNISVGPHRSGVR
jgi:chitin disaccharide deacetylase